MARRRAPDPAKDASERPRSQSNRRGGAASENERPSKNSTRPAKPRRKRADDKKANRADPSVPLNRRRAPAAKQQRRPEQRVGARARLRAARERLDALWERAKKPLLVAGRLVLVLVSVAGAVAVGRLVETHVRTSPAFAVQRVGVVGNERLFESEILHIAGLELGQNVFDMPPEDARERLSRHPWIRSASVTRRLPGAYDVAVVERRAVAVLALDGLYLVGDDGTVFKRLEDEDPVDLPIVSGVSRGRFTSDRAYRTSILLEVVALMHDYRGAGLWRREPIAEIHVEDDDELTLYVGDDALYVRLGQGPFRAKLHKLRRVLDRLDEREARAAYVYLDNVRRPDRVTVRIR